MTYNPNSHTLKAIRVIKKEMGIQSHVFDSKYRADFILNIPRNNPFKPGMSLRAAPTAKAKREYGSSTLSRYARRVSVNNPQYLFLGLYLLVNGWVSWYLTIIKKATLLLFLSLNLITECTLQNAVLKVFFRSPSDDHRKSHDQGRGWR